MGWSIIQSRSTHPSFSGQIKTPSDCVQCVPALLSGQKTCLRIPGERLRLHCWPWVFTSVFIKRKAPPPCYNIFSLFFPLTLLFLPIPPSFPSPHLQILGLGHCSEYSGGGESNVPLCPPPLCFVFVPLSISTKLSSVVKKCRLHLQNWIAYISTLA